jgi:hypothetical protein
VCQDVGFPGPPAGFCGCTPPGNPGCGAPPDGPPACFGPCPPGTVCQFDGLGACLCAPMFEPCGPLTPWPMCDGSCPPGLVCQDAGFPGPMAGVCACTPPGNPGCGALPDGPPACYGPCPPGDVCIFNGAGVCLCVPGSPSGAFLTMEEALLD